MNYFQRWRSRLCDVLLPQICALCRSPTGSKSIVCPDCISRLPRLPAASCPRCADFSAGAALCGRCVASPPAFAGVNASFLFAEPVDQLVHRLKYAHHLYTATWLGEQLLASLRDRAGTSDVATCSAILPMPLHPNRIRQRGFNQSLEIARPVAAGLGIPLLADAVLRSLDTAPQTSLGRDARRQNIKGAFECRTDFSGRSVLVVDDVVTTGGSADELALTLQMHGAQTVWIACVARTQHP